MTDLNLGTIRHVAVTTFNKWLEDRAPRTAAALAYYSVFSLAPLLLIAAGLAGLMFGEEEAREQILQQAVAILGTRGAEAVQGMMASGQTASRAGVVSTVAGFVTLMVGAVGVLAQLKDALNTIWRADAVGQSSWSDLFRQYVLNFALVVATAFLLLVSLVATAVMGAATTAAHAWLAGPPAAWFLVDSIVGLAMTTAIFALIFRVIPDADVAWKDAAIGAFVTAILFTVGRMALGWYLGREASDSTYAAAGSVLALLLWVYDSAQLVLLGAEFTYVVAQR